MVMMLLYWVEPYILTRKTKGLIVISKEMDLEVNAEKTKSCLETSI